MADSIISASDIYETCQNASNSTFPYLPCDNFYHLFSAGQLLVPGLCIRLPLCWIVPCNACFFSQNQTIQLSVIKGNQNGRPCNSFIFLNWTFSCKGNHACRDSMSKLPLPFYAWYARPARFRKKYLTNVNVKIYQLHAYYMCLIYSPFK